MVPSTLNEPPQLEALLQRAAADGDLEAWGTLLVQHQERLCRMAGCRLDPRLCGRIDPADVVQEAYAAAAEHRADYFVLPPPVPLFLWLRGIVGNKLLEIHRRHLGTGMRDADREVASCRPSADATSTALVDHLPNHATGPQTDARRSEALGRLRRALDSLDGAGREVLVLRHFEQLTNSEAAAVLGIQERAAAQRYVRALKRLKDLLAAMPGGLTEVRP